MNLNNYSGDYDVIETRNTFKVFDEDGNYVAINKNILENVKSSEEPTRIAILYAIIEFSRLDEKAFKKRSKVNLIEMPEVWDRINFLLETSNIEFIINKLSQMKYFEMVAYLLEGIDEFFGESEEEDLEEV